MAKFLSKPSEAKQRMLDRLYADHGAALRSFVGLRMGGGHSDVDDVVQDVFTKLAQMDDLKGRLPSAERSVRAYIFQMASNHIVNMYRYKRVRRQHLEREQPHALESSGDEQSPERIVLAQRELESIRETIEKLPLPCRQAFVLNRFKQKTYVEVAEYMGVSVKQVEKYMQKSLIAIRRAVKRLREAEK
ncbi:sigma-70 family RNA polymerase sigma factor [Porticoccus sp. W117]|uniref:sigma-70 family RNA polymerase sigma factor n=1 Tax=Porticoccus sp. W117 TaxID=3054777 RepID=UPI002599E0F6|nr:sigma-70 family RNA polymerase sigma factor [Porticoccus sp. W117]MDM3870461.1 sigma-70 family RNA polymerase sigma factor [Porticoccus sp. W117]